MTIPIKTIKLRRLKMTLNNPFTTSFGTIKEKEFFITEAIDDSGNRGFGESVAFLTPWYTEETVETNHHIMKDVLIKLLKENAIDHPDDVSNIFRPVKRNHMAKAALEGAIWDLYAKRENITLSEALGGTRKQIDVGISIGIQPTVEDLLEKISHHVNQGYKRIKMKIKPGWDYEVLREIRNHFPDIPLMADANSAYTLKDIEQLKKLNELNLMMIEQPLAHDDIIDHAKLQAAIKTPICLDESIHSLEDARKAIELKSCQVINVKIGRVGGLTEAKKIHDLSRENNIDIWCGGMLEAGIGRAHNIALATLPQFTLPGDTAGSSLYWKKDIIQPEVTVHDGVITVPDKPGIGFEIDDEALDAFTIDEEVFDI
ncbi:o-succinylbenzoate synthase [Lentibacillus salicampi]|uniref:o-succinylbenzoate synthase n=1 Tax=Lentibacillus salicampi TaxID=175306 RepID=A0A4Y9AAC5_9BACI|nr:o-succinylbenzoate synthase [Lentibacillus salicampi]TFJ92733.1 o-succinylbenzoate synthase [Lentibacillus salicampi]